ncbi:UNVERIFIED_CONTAM: hypothetical protein FKN15_015456 [Acipenser sinensis]
MPPPAEGDELLFLRPPAEGDKLLFLPPPAEGDTLLFLPPPAEGDELLFPPPPAEGDEASRGSAPAAVAWGLRRSCFTWGCYTVAGAPRRGAAGHEELGDGVYSLQLTTDPDLESETAETVTRLPYFSLLRRQQDEQNQKAVNLHAELNQNKEIATVQMGKWIHTKQASQHEITVSELKSTLQGAQGHISNLNQFKELYDGLQEAFQFPVAKKNKNNLATISPKAPTNRKAVMATKKAHLHSYLKTTRNQEHQLLKVQNSVIADFEACIENHKKWLLSEKFRHSTQREEHEILMEEEEFAEKQNIFQQSMADISTELALLKQHRKSLQEQLNVLEKSLHQVLCRTGSDIIIATQKTGF